MDKIHHYSVFAAAPGGGKQFAIAEGVSNPLQMQQIAAQSGQPLTGFILNAGTERVEARFFSPTKEKGASDSGALVVAEHLRRQGAIQDRVLVQMGEEGLEVCYQDEKWWSRQEDITTQRANFNVSMLLDILGTRALAGLLELLVGKSKINVFIPVEHEGVLRGIHPQMDTLEVFQKATKHNGYVVCVLNSGADVSLRFFSPAKNIPEDNAGSYTVASVCGYFAKNFMGKVHLGFLQGEAMGKPSRLYAHFDAENGTAKNIMVGGKIETL